MKHLEWTPSIGGFQYPIEWSGDRATVLDLPAELFIEYDRQWRTCFCYNVDGPTLLTIESHVWSSSLTKALSILRLKLRTALKGIPTI